MLFSGVISKYKIWNWNNKKLNWIPMLRMVKWNNRRNILTLNRVKTYPANTYLFKVNKSTRKRCKICSKLTIKRLKRRQWHRSGFFVVNFEQINLCLLRTLSLTKFLLILIKTSDNEKSTIYMVLKSSRPYHE